jgi:hypothetical protein
VSDEQADRMARMMRNANQTAEFVVGRVSVQEGRTFSEEAMEQLNHELVTWVATRLMRRWEATQEPPTYLKVVVTVEVG